MSQQVKNVNRFIKTAIRSEIDDIVEKLALSDRQLKIFEMFYIQKKDILFIADTIGVSEVVVHRELKIVRIKLVKVLGY